MAEGHATDPETAFRRFVEGETTGPSTTAVGPRVRHGQLTRREVEILRLLAQGKTDGDIAAALYISPKTASVHVSNVKAKLGVDTRVDAALAARDMGLAKNEEPSKDSPDGEGEPAA